MKTGERATPPEHRKLRETIVMTTTTAAKPFDPVKYKETTREQWQSAAQAWNDWGPLLRAWLGPSTEIMLDMAAIEPGHGYSTWRLGGRPDAADRDSRWTAGRVLATDISPNILAFAEVSARNAGLGNVETKVLDGEELDVPEGAFDAVISRVGLIYFPDQQKALAGMKRALKPGGRVAAMVYSTAESNKFFSIPVSIIRRRANLSSPLPGQPGPFSLGGPGVLEESFRKAGFRDVLSRTIPAPVRTKTAAECVRFEKESFGALHQMLAGLDEAGREAAWREIEQELGAFEGKAGFEGPCEMVVAVGVK